MKPTLVVIGNGMVGQNFLAGFVQTAAAADYHIVTFCEEPRPAYDRVHLSEFFSGKTAADLSLVEDGFFEQHNITLHLGDRAATIDRAAKTVTSAKGVTIHYDKLVLATGSYPFVPPVPGHDRRGHRLDRERGALRHAARRLDLAGHDRGHCGLRRADRGPLCLGAQPVGQGLIRRGQSAL